MPPTTSDYQALRQFWRQRRTSLLDSYAQGRHSFLPGLLPELALELSTPELLDILRSRLGEDRLEQALDHRHTVSSPVQDHPSPDWLKRVNMVGINVRTIGHFWNVIKYALTLPASQAAVHLLPIWEPGVVDSLYGMASWQLNDEFFSAELAEARPGLDTVERQLKVVVNLLHAQGRLVGMDVIPHTDRFSEIVLANPHFFEWLQRDERRILDHHAALHRRVQTLIFDWIFLAGSASPAIEAPADTETFFSDAYGEERRRRVLFGADRDRPGRSRRRDELITHLYQYGFEPVPATMAPPYRGIVLDEGSGAVDDRGRHWVDYRIERPGPMSRVFGPLTRYKLYERLDDNRDWQIDFSRPHREVWDYICRQYGAVQAAYHLDFMRGDMAHVQMRAPGVPSDPDEFYDIHRAIKRYIQRRAPYFGYFAESFLAAPGVMAYGDEVDHLEGSQADTVLGDLQSMVVGSPRFLRQLRWYLDLAATRRFVPSFTVMTADKDDPRFDEFYRAGNEARMFIALFVTDLPSYMALGFEVRDPHAAPAPNEHYTKLYVFRIAEGEKATRGPYRWGRNGCLFHRLNRLRLFAEDILPALGDRATRWLLYPDPTAARAVIAWTQREHAEWLFVVNLNTDHAAPPTILPGDFPAGCRAVLRFSTHRDGTEDEPPLPCREPGFRMEELAPGEGRAYRLSPPGTA